VIDEVFVKNTTPILVVFRRQKALEAHCLRQAMVAACVVAPSFFLLCCAILPLSFLEERRCNNACDNLGLTKAILQI
jgi:hypothetical protein